MKIRQGFISNSSSTSFIIEVIPPIPCKYCGRKDISIIDLIDKGYNETGICAKGKEEVLEYMSGWIDDKNIIDKIKKAKGEIYLFRIAYNDESLQNLVNNSKNFNIIYKDD